MHLLAERGEMFHRRNVYAKILITFILGLGILCAFLAMRTCRWFVYLQTDQLFLEDWEFLPDVARDAIESVGIFGYAFSDGSRSNSTTAMHEECRVYPGIWVGTKHPWKFAAQIFSVLGPTVAIISVFVMVVGGNRFWICTFLLLATAVQLSAVVSSLSWCSDATDYWHCPWLFGALMNLTASILFAANWLMALWTLETNTNSEESNVESLMNDPSKSRVVHDYYNKNKGEGEGGQNTTRNDTTEPSAMFPLSEIIFNDDKDKGSQDFSVISTESSVYIPDLEGGNANGYSSCGAVNRLQGGIQDDETSLLQKDYSYHGIKSFDEETKSAMKRISQSNQMFMDLESKLKERNLQNQVVDDDSGNNTNGSSAASVVYDDESNDDVGVDSISSA